MNPEDLAHILGEDEDEDDDDDDAKWVTSSSTITVADLSPMQTL